MMRLQHKQWALVLCVLAAWVCGCAEDAPSLDQTNIVIVVADDVGWEDFGAYGHPHIRTPHIDGLAQQGARFDNAYLTTSSCSPSRASILTGLYPHNTGAMELGTPLPGDVMQVTTPLREAGYWTVAVGKWHLGRDAKAQWDQVQPVAWEEAAAMGDRWVQALRERPRDKPFLLWASSVDAHREYKPDTIAQPHRRGDVVVPPYYPDTDEVRDDLAMYYDEVSRFDEHVGLLLDELESQGIAGQTFVLVISDNGRPFPQSKTRVNNQGVKTPFIVRWPGVARRGTEVKGLVSAVDIAPTLLAVAGLTAPETMPGVSLEPMLRDPSVSVRPYAYAEHNWHGTRAFERAVFDGRYCYIRNWLPHLINSGSGDSIKSPTFKVMRSMYEAGTLPASQSDVFMSPRPAEELYDLEQDPDCMNNLADDPEHADRQASLRQTLETWQDATQDRFPGEEHLRADEIDRWTGERLAQ